MFDEYLELIVWYEDDEKSIYGFQLSYDRLGEERVVTWLKKGTFMHCLLTQDSTAPGKNLTQMLVKGGDFDKTKLISEFTKRSIYIDDTIRMLVLSKLEEAECDA